MVTKRGQSTGRRRASLAGMAVTLALALAGATAPFAAAKIPFTDTKLKNGLRVIISEDHSAPVFSIAVNYNVGSRDERKGRTGFAHLFEHMMFKGSEQRRPGRALHAGLQQRRQHERHDQQGPHAVLRDAAGQPARPRRCSSKPTACGRSTITKENLDNQRNAVQEERRLGVDNQPYGKTFEAIDELAYENFAYEHSVIGSMADLSAATVDDVAAFFKTYYAPNNAVLAIVGDVDTTDGARRRCGSTSSRIPSQPAPPPVDMTEPPQKAERRQTLEDALARLPRLDMVCTTPPALSPDDDALDRAGHDALERPQLALLREPSSGRSSSRRASTRRRRAAAARGCSGSIATALPGKSRRRSRERRSTPRSRR